MTVATRLSRRHLLASAGAGAAVVVLPTAARSPASPWPAARAAAIAARVTPPRIPDRVFPVAAYGGRGDGRTDNSGAIARAIAACAAAGGGRVLLPPGVCRTGPIRLRSSMALDVPKGTRLSFIPEPERYLPPVMTRWEGVELMGYQPLIYALDEHDVAVVGGGVIDGGADDTHWWPWKGPWADRYKDTPASERQQSDRDRLFAMAERGVPVAERVFGRGSRLRPPLFQPYRCTNVMMRGVTLTASPFWIIHPVLCRNVLIRDVTCDSHGPNNDGIDPESCTDVLIDNCTLDTGDDCIALKSGRNADGRRLARPCENVVIRHCRMRDGHAGVAIGSELSGGIRNVFVHDCAMDSPHLTRALIVKTNSYRGGVVEDIHLTRLTIGQVERAVIQLWMHYEEGDGGPQRPVIRRISLSDTTVADTERVLVVRGRGDSPVANILLDRVTVKRARAASVVVDARDVRLYGVTVGGRPFTDADLRRLPGLDSVDCDKWATCRSRG